MPRLKRLNLSRNKIVRLATDLLRPGQDFMELQEIDVSFNWIESERDLWFLSQTRSVNLVIITGNPLASSKKGVAAYENLESELQKNLSAVVINDSALVDDQGFYVKKKTGQQRQLMQYPNPIKLDDNTKPGSSEGKKEYLNAADKMRNAATLQITDIRPDTNLESEIFPKELSGDVPKKDVFTPPNHQQMRFADGQDAFPPKKDDDEAFFITEDVRPDNSKDDEAIEEEKSYATEAEDS